MGVPIIRFIVFGGLYLGPLILGNYHISFGAGIVASYELCFLFLVICLQTPSPKA